METDAVTLDDLDAYRDDEGTCPDCGALFSEECEADCPSWDEEAQDEW